METKYIYQAIDNFFDKCFEHTRKAVIEKQGGYTSGNPFSIFMGKLIECIYYENNKPYSTEPNFDLNGFDNGVDLYINNEPVSIKMRVLPHSKNTYLDSNNMVFGRQFITSFNLIKDLPLIKCKYMLGVIRYESNKYFEWLEAWDHNNVQQLKEIIKFILEYECIWFSTKTGNIILDY